MEIELQDKVIAFCEALKSYKGSSTSQQLVNAIIHSDLFKEIYDCAYNEKMFALRTKNQLTNINQ